MGAVMNIGSSRAKVYNTEKPKTTFADVAGYGPVKQEISEVVDFLKNPGKFKEIGARIPKGVLLVGPPGTGKTLIARAVAGEAGVPFVSVTGSDFMEMFVGVGAARVRDLFQTARKQAPAIIFVDEIDSIGRKRGAGLGGGHDEREQTLNQMLAEMDGFEATEGIVMMAATNRPDVLDPALLRPGRFDRQIMVPLPTQEERRDILVVHFKDKKMSSDVDVNIVARGTPGMAGADLANLVNEAALFAVRRGDNEIHANDFDDARDRVLMGLRRPSIVMNDLEKEHTAYHEAGHAVAAYVFEHADPVHKVTILPTGMALGMTQQMPVEERYSHDKEYLARLAGRVHGRARGRGDHVRHQVDRRPERPRARHRDRPPHGAGVGHERPHRADGLGLRGRGLPGRGPRAHPRLLRRDRPGDRRRGRAHPPRRGEPHPRHAHRAPARSGRGGRGAARAGDRRRRRGRHPRRHRDGPQERRAPPGTARRRLRGDRRDDAATATRSPTTSSSGSLAPARYETDRRGRVPGVLPGCAQLGDRRPEVGGGERADEGAAHHALGRRRSPSWGWRRARSGGAGRRVDSAAISHTATSDDSNGSSFEPRPWHESQAADENSATNQAASPRGKSARSSCLGTGYTSRGGASGGRRRRNHASAPTATRITAAITKPCRHRALILRTTGRGSPS